MTQYAVLPLVKQSENSVTLIFMVLFIIYPQFLSHIASNLSYKLHLSRQYNCWSLRCSWSTACQHCSNYIFILNLVPCFNGLGRDNCKTGWETFKCWDLVHLILEVWQYMGDHADKAYRNFSASVFMRPWTLVFTQYAKLIIKLQIFDITDITIFVIDFYSF